MSKILIIEDEASIRRVLVKILSEEDKSHEIYEAEDGLSALNNIKKENFDLILCDIKMPKMDGIEVLEFSYFYKINIIILIDKMDALIGLPFI